MIGDTLLTDPDVSVEEYLKEMPGNQFTINLCIEQVAGSSTRVASALRQLMDGVPEISGHITLYIAEADLIAQIRDYITTHGEIFAEFDDMTAQALIGSVPFENGNFSLVELLLDQEQKKIL